jgi:hypothetical protein
MKNDFAHRCFPEPNGGTANIISDSLVGVPLARALWSHLRSFERASYDEDNFHELRKASGRFKQDHSGHVKFIASDDSPAHLRLGSAGVMVGDR